MSPPFWSWVRVLVRQVAAAFAAVFQKVMCQGVPTHWHRRGVPSDFMRAFAPVTRDKRGAHLRFSGTHLVVDLPPHTPQRHRGMLGPPPLVPPPPKSPHMSHGPHRVAGVRLGAPIAVDFTALCLAGRWTSPRVAGPWRGLRSWRPRTCATSTEVFVTARRVDISLPSMHCTAPAREGM